MSGTKTKLLLIDDDPAIRHLLSKWLTPHHYEIAEASDGREAMEQISADCPDVIITDWDLPEVNGVDLCRWLRAEQLPKYVYVLFLSVRCGSGDMIRALEAGADDFLKKPIDKGELLARLRASSRVLDLESRLTLLANTDALTGLATQRTFYHSLAVESSRAIRHENSLTCVKIDLDHFQHINDVHGPSVGDDVIRRVGRTLRAGCRDSDIVARYGGEEFCVLLPGTNEEGATIWADRMRQAIGALEFAVDVESLRVTASFGVAQMKIDMAEEPRRLVLAADEALLVAKAAGRDRVVVHGTLNGDGNLKDAHDDAGELLGDVTAADVMTTIVAGLNKNAKVSNAADYFLRFRIPSAPVIDDDGHLVGILSERDVMGVMLWPDWSNTRVEQVMKTNVITYDEQAPVMSIYEFLCRVSIRAVIIVNDGRPTGILSRASLVRWFANAHLAQRAQAANSPSGEVGLGDALRRVRGIAQALQEEAQQLVDATNTGDDNLMPTIVGGASRMQELANDLLAVSPGLQRPHAWATDTYEAGSLDTPHMSRHTLSS